MYQNINAGLGRLMGDGLFGLTGVPTTGHVYMVGAASLASYNEVSSMYGTYVDGKLVLYTTIALASAQCVAGRGDVILVLPGHTESISSATALTMSVSGVSVIGLGVGSLRPVVTLDTAATATINVTAAGVSFKNIVFVANFQDVASCFTLTAAKDFAIDSCEFRDTSSILNFLVIVTTSATNNAADGLKFVNNYVYSLPATAGAVVSVLGNVLRLNVSHNTVDKAATNDAGQLITMSSKVTGGVRIVGNCLTVVGSAGATVGILFTGSQTTGSGICADNYVSSLDTTTALIATAGTGIAFIQNFLTGAADKSGAVWPVADNPA